MSASCGICIFWAPREWDPEAGYCRRYAPTHEGWPETEAAHWCGEYSDEDGDEGIVFIPDPEAN